MNYQKVYDSLIERAKSRGLNKKLLNYYTEKHHIIPRCMNGTNEKSNLVLLTGREHYLCHYLLWKANKDNYKLFFAFRMMALMFCKNTQYKRYKVKLSSKQYEYISFINAEHVKKLQFGKRLSATTKKLISDSKRGKHPWNYNLKHSDETRIKIGLSNAGKVRSLETIEKMKLRKNDHFKGKTHSDEIKALLSMIKSKPVIINGVNYSSYKHAYEILNPSVCYTTFISKCKMSLI